MKLNWPIGENREVLVAPVEKLPATTWSERAEHDCRLEDQVVESAVEDKMRLIKAALHRYYARRQPPAHIGHKKVVVEAECATLGAEVRPI